MADPKTQQAQEGQKQAPQQPIQINKLLQTVVNQNASDLLLTVDAKPMVRLNGRLVALQTRVLGPEDTVALMKSISSERNQRELQEVGSSDFGFSFGEQARFRVSIFKQRGHVGLALRLIPFRLRTFEEIGLDTKIITRLLHRPRGVILVTGPTGSGKSTTLATMIDYINRQRDCHIITVEDPIEYYHSHKRSIITQRELGVDVPSFAEGLRRALRQDPDVILVGEMRDLETMETAISAAETGHLVFATLHTNSAEGTVNRIVDAFPEQQQEQVRIQLASNLVAVICQALIPTANGRDRVAAFEIMIRTPAISNLIRTQKTYQIESEIQTGSKHGMILLDDSLAKLALAGKITPDEAMNRCRNLPEMINRLSSILDPDAIKVGPNIPTAETAQQAAAGASRQGAPAPGGRRKRPSIVIDAARAPEGRRKK
jgi:twitching motility protein PilT